MILTTTFRKKQIIMQFYQKEKGWQWITTGKTQMRKKFKPILEFWLMGLVDLPEIEEYFQGDFCVWPIVRQIVAYLFRQIFQLHKSYENSKKF